MFAEILILLRELVINPSFSATNHLAGLVGVNSGSIASSYYMGGSVINSSTKDYTAGLVVENSGKIYTSYVSGTASV